MNTGKLIQFIVVAVLVFSVWVAFALLVVNPFLYPYVPGYRVGQPCGWEFVALFASIGIAYFWTRKWPSPEIEGESSNRTISLNYGFVLFLLLYLLAAVTIFLWEYSKFSASFG